MDPDGIILTTQRTPSTLASIFGDEGVFDHYSPPHDRDEWSHNRTRKGHSRYRVVDDISPDPHETDVLLPTKNEQFQNVGYNALHPSPDALQGLSTTFMHMEYRKLKRSSSSSYHDHPRGRLLGACYAIIFLSYFIYRLVMMRQEDDWQNEELWKEIILEFLVALVLCYASYRLNTLANSLTVMWIYVLVTGFFLLEKQTFRFLLGAVLGAMAVTWLCHVLYFYIGPLILRESRYCFGWRRVKSRVAYYSQDEQYAPGGEDLREVVFEYRPPSSYITCSSPNTFVYRGGWKEGAPSGWGEWRDDSFHGESLVGYWE